MKPITTLTELKQAYGSLIIADAQMVIRAYREKTTVTSIMGAADNFRDDTSAPKKDGCAQGFMRTFQVCAQAMPDRIKLSLWASPKRPTPTCSVVTPATIQDGNALIPGMTKIAAEDIDGGNIADLCELLKQWAGSAWDVAADKCQA